MASKKEELLVTEDAVFPIEKLREYSKQVFGVNVEVFDAALHGSNESALSKEAVANKIDVFLKKEVGV